MVKKELSLAVTLLVAIASVRVVNAQETVDETNQKMAAMRGQHMVELPKYLLTQLQQKEEQKQVLKDEAYEHISKGKFSNAIVALEKIKELGGDFPYCLYGDLLETVGRNDAAISAYRRAIYKWNKDKHGRSISNWDEQVGRRFNSMSVDELEKIITLSDSSNKARYALLLSRSERYDEALQVYTWAVKGLLSAEGVEVYGKGWHEALQMKMTPQNFDKAKFEAACYTLLGRTYVDDNFGPWFDIQTKKLYTNATSSSASQTPSGRLVAAEHAIQTNSRFAPAYILVGQLYTFYADKESLTKAQAAYLTAKSLSRTSTERTMAEQGLQ